MHMSLKSAVWGLTGAMLAVAGTAGVARAAIESDGYVTSRSGEIVRTRDGSCVTTRLWTPDMAVAECHPGLVQAQAPVEPAEPTEMAAMEPERVSRFITVEADTTFDFDEATLTERGKSDLDEVVSMYRDAQDPRIKVVGYTDWIGTEEYNQDLSQRRADAVREYLANQGIPEDSIEIAARGESNPVVQCQGMSGQALIECLRPNRRSEIEFSAFETIEVPRDQQAPQ